MTFSQFLSILRARWRRALAVFFGTVLLVVVVSLLLPKKYTGVASVVVDVSPDPIAGMLSNAMVGPSIVATQVDIINSDRVARKVIRNLKLAEHPEIQQQWREATDGVGTVEEWLVDLLQRHLDVKPSLTSNVIVITYKASDPKFAADIANAFAQAFIETTIELRVDPARQYAGYFESRIKAARESLATAQGKLSEYQLANGIVDGDERLDAENARLQELSNQLVLMQTVSAESSSRQAQAAVGNGDRMAEATNNPAIAGMKVDLSRAEASLQELNSRLGANHPQVLQAKANIAELHARLDAETRRLSSGVGVTASIDSARLAQVRGQLDTQRTKVLSLKASRNQMAVLQKDVENAQHNYDAVAARASESSLQSQTPQSNVNLLSSAVAPIVPSSPKLVLNTLVSIFLGLLLAIGATLLRELKDRLVRRDSDITELLGLPVLGSIPRPIGGKKKLQTLMAQRVLFSRLTAPKKS